MESSKHRKAFYTERELIDLDSQDDLRKLQDWCQLHWKETILKGVQGCNAPVYHDCCISFSRRCFTKKDSHPPIQTASILKVPGLRYAHNHMELYKWLRDRLTDQYRLGKKVYFPTVNTAHYTQDDDDGPDPYEQVRMLCKRVSDLTKEFDKHLDEVHRLREENKSLLQAKKHWYQKYQDLLYKEETPSYMVMTPLKKSVCVSKDFDVLQLT